MSVQEFFPFPSAVQSQRSISGEAGIVEASSPFITAPSPET